MDSKTQESLRQLPSVAEVLERPDVGELIVRFGHPTVRQAVRQEIAALRERLLQGEAAETSVDTANVTTRAERLTEPSLIPVINATGVVVHTNLGRSPLPPEVAARVLEVASGYCNLEYDLAGGQRGHRHAHAAGLIAAVADAEAALVVNNCAAAVLLCLSALARGKEVIVSRGELVEIGGSFRVPDVMKQSGATLVEVGTTNRTRLADYRDAVTERTGLLLKVHRSNFAVVGFTEEVGPAELASLGREVSIPTMVDLGSGLVDRPADATYAPEPTMREITRAEVDLLTCSGDKQLGGPQAGIIAGRTELVRRLATHPLLRALRPDKLTLGALEATLSLHVTGRASTDVPAVRMIGEPLATVTRRRTRLLRALKEQLPQGLHTEPRATTARPGGGALPLAEIPSAGISLRHDSLSARRLHERLRQGRPPVVGRIEDDELILDLRTVLPEQVPQLAEAIIGLDLTGP